MKKLWIAATLGAAFLLSGFDQLEKQAELGRSTIKPVANAPSKCITDESITEDQRKKIESLVRQHYLKSDILSVDMGFKTQVGITTVAGPGSARTISVPQYPHGVFEKAFRLHIDSLSQEIFNGNPVRISDNDTYYIELCGGMAYQDNHYNGPGFHNSNVGLIPLDGWLRAIFDYLTSQSN